MRVWIIMEIEYDGEMWPLGASLSKIFYRKVQIVIRQLGDVFFIKAFIYKINKTGEEII